MRLNRRYHEVIQHILDEKNEIIYVDLSLIDELGYVPRIMTPKYNYVYTPTLSLKEGILRTITNRYPCELAKIITY